MFYDVLEEFSMNKEKRIQYLAGSIALLIVSLYFWINPNFTYIVSGKGFLGVVLFLILSIYHLIKYLKEKKK
jgi:hypothetical protein